MDPREIIGTYKDFNLPNNYFEPPDLTRRLPVHDDYLLNSEHVPRLLPQYPISRPFHPHEDVTVKRYIGSGVAFVSLITENLLSHPFLVLRRQCQVNHSSKSFHLLPFTLLPTVCHLHQYQGLTTLWKGLGSVLVVKGMTIGVEDLISKLTPWPKEISWHSSLKQFFHHTLLKCVSLAIVTPFYSASFVETVQSEIASERPGILDVFREGFRRVLYWGSSAKGRMLPIWALIVPSVALGLAKYLLSMMIKGATVRILSIRKNKWEGETVLEDVNKYVMQDINLTASLIATIASDVVFYPCETVVHRLHLQGTRTIIDNLSDGRSVLPILTNYSGAFDCYEKCLATEGPTGLYKGFGALILQYMAHIALVKFSRFLLSEAGALFKKPDPKPRVPEDIPASDISSVTGSPKFYLLP